MKRNLSAYSYSHIIFLLLLPNSQQVEGIFIEGYRKIHHNLLPLILWVTSLQFFFLIGSHNRFHLLTLYILAALTVLPQRLLHSTRLSVAPQMGLEQAGSEPGTIWTLCHSMVYAATQDHELNILFVSACWCNLKLLDRVVSGARFLTGGVFECDIAHHRSVAVRCMMYEIGCNSMHTLNDALPGPYVPVRVTRGALVAYRYTYAPSRCKTSQYRRTFVPLSCSVPLERSCLPRIRWCGIGGF